MQTYSGTISFEETRALHISATLAGKFRASVLAARRVIRPEDAGDHDLILEGVPDVRAKLVDVNRQLPIQGRTYSGAVLVRPNIPWLDFTRQGDRGKLVVRALDRAVVGIAVGSGGGVSVLCPAAHYRVDMGDGKRFIIT